MIVGGRDFNMTKEQVEERMRGVEPEMVQKHVVEMHGTVYPPKQVLGHVTGWGRATFTTMEAQRVLRRLGFVCREAGSDITGAPVWLLTTDEPDEPPAKVSDADRITTLEAALSVAQEAIAGLAARVRALEGA